MLQALLLYGLGPFCVLATLVPFHKGETWWVRVCDFPRTQLAVLIVATLAGILTFTNMSELAWAMSSALLVCLGTQLTVILPYTRLWAVEVRRTGDPPGPRTISLLIVDVLMENRTADRLTEIIMANDPDLILAVETDDWWRGQLEKALDRYPFRVAHPLPNTYGMLLLSRLELVNPEVRFLLKPDIPSIRTGVRLRSGEAVTLYGLHPEPPAPGEAETSLAEASDSVTVAGDLNDVAWSHTSRLFRRISRLLDPRVGRGMYNTFHARYWALRWPLDDVFVSDTLVLRRLQRLPFFGSDHFPVYIALDHVPAASAVQEAPAPDADDHAEAREKVAHAAESESG
jgi:endonuclease/exonuclease/phosphatase (EEP) superfamily protein YafD